MEEPPSITIPIPDLRTVASEEKATPSLEFLEVLNDALIKQQWYRTYQEDHKNPILRFVGKYSSADDAAAVAGNMRLMLGIDDNFRRECASWQQFLTSFVRSSEDAGVLVMRNSIVRHEVRRGLNPQEFRGFAISDDLAPLVFINAADAKAAQIFTLAHELAHIWIGQSGISNINPRKKRSSGKSRNQIERFCNHVAAELLVPEVGFEDMWNRGGDVPSMIRKIAAFHRVSAVVVLMRAYELGKLDYESFSEMMDAEYARFHQQEQQKKDQEEETTGNFWASFNVRNGRRLSNSVAESVREGRLVYTEAANLLGVKVKTLTKFLAKHSGE
jgi:Zn-dependent peptidase ImmA (M78 family)